jgi:8-hydroxy-5-deazaflavin:NADPH oxidoreductase
VAGFIESIGYSVVDAGSRTDSWRQPTGTPGWGTPYGRYSDEKGQPVGENAIRLATSAAAR